MVKVSDIAAVAGVAIVGGVMIYVIYTLTKPNGNGVYKVYGTVVDVITRYGVPNATVAYGTQTTLTDENGHFEIADPLVDEGDVTVTANGYEPSIPVHIKLPLLAPLIIPLGPEGAGYITVCEGTATGWIWVQSDGETVQIQCMAGEPHLYNWDEYERIVVFRTEGGILRGEVLTRNTALPSIHYWNDGYYNVRAYEAVGMGSVKITSNPSGAKILFGVSDTGYVTPAVVEHYVGTYRVFLELAGYETASVDVTVDPEIINEYHVDLTPLPCSSHGNETDCVNAGCYWYWGSCHSEPEPPKGTAHISVIDASPPYKPINMAGVQFGLFGCQTDSAGYCMIDSIPTGAYNVTISAFGYNTFTTSETISEGDNYFYYSLTPIGPRIGTVHVNVYDSVTSSPINGAFVDFGWPYQCQTNSSGYCRINNVPPGLYSTEVTAFGYQLFGQTSIVFVGDNYFNFYLWM